MRRAVLTLLAVGSFFCIAGAQSPPLDAIVGDPHRFAGQTVTVIGQFRGWNLFGDLADDQAPAERVQFVLRSGDAAVWVTGLQPRGQHFSLDVTRRDDAGRWIKVTGTVETKRGRVWIRGTTIDLAPPQPEAAVAISLPPLPAAPLDVVFTTPVRGEAGVRLDTTIRIQFSDDVDPATLEGRIRLSYSKSDSVERGEAQPPSIPFAIKYLPEPHALEIRPTAPLERFREVTVTLSEGIKSRIDGVLKPWSLTFTTGGS